jgi:branched-chain amino acid transport system permease protein
MFQMLSNTVIGSIMYASILILLCIGFSFTHLLEKFPNLTHTSLATVGTMIAFALSRLQGVNPYLTWPIAAIGTGLLSVLLYLLVVRPIRRSGGGGVQITFAMFALTYIINSVLATFSYWVMVTQDFTSRGFVLRNMDFSMYGLPAILFVAPFTCIVLVSLLHLFLTRSKQGIAIRATADDPNLATSLGINVFHVHVVSWFMTGALAGLAGAALPLWQPTSLGGSDRLMMTVIAGSVLGGLDNIYGAIVGGLFLSFTQRVLPSILMNAVGIWIAAYIPLFPLLIIIAVLFIEPQGLTGLRRKK